MRHTIAYASILFASFAFAACNSDTLPSGTTDGTGGTARDLAVTQTHDLSSTPTFDLTSAPVDAAMSQPGDMAFTPLPYDAGISCGNQVCPNTQKCCVSYVNRMLVTACADSCPDGGVTVACSGPENCGGNPCCAQFMNTNMGIQTTGAMCTSAQTDCPPEGSFQTMSGQTRMCHVSTDCTSGAPNTMFPDCCTYTQNGQSAQFCFSKQYAGFVMGFNCP